MKKIWLVEETFSTGNSYVISAHKNKTYAAIAACEYALRNELERIPESLTWGDEYERRIKLVPMELQS